MHQFGIGDQILAIILFSAIAYKILSLALLLFFTLTFVSLLTWRYYEDKQYWRRLGIPGPKPNIFFGNMLEWTKKGLIEFDKDTFSRYGKTYGSYFFDRHVICTIDRELLRHILIKDFSYFTNRFNVVEANSEFAKKNLMRNMISLLLDDDWRRVRNRVTPAFTTGKLKRIMPILLESSKKMRDLIEQEYAENGKELPLKDLFGRLVLEEIGRAGYSLDFSLFIDNEQNNTFMKHTKDIFSGNHIAKTMFMSLCPFTLNYLEKFFTFDAMNSPALKYFNETMTQIYEQRKADPNANEKFNDMFQLLINAVDENMDEEAKKPAVDDNEIMHRELELTGPDTGKAPKKNISKIELFAQSFILLIAGYETTASTMHFAVYLLAMFPDMQDRLREEIKNVLGDSEEISYEKLKEMHFLQAITRETLRYYPPAPQLVRECKEDININGVPFRRGDIVSMPVHLINHCEEYYEQPQKFDPERFLPGNKEHLDPIGFLSFGMGPRNCIGMRLAELQIYLALVTLIRHFRFKPGPNTPELPLKLHATTLLQTEKPLCVLAEKI